MTHLYRPSLVSFQDESEFLNELIKYMSKELMKACSHLLPVESTVFEMHKLRQAYSSYLELSDRYMTNRGPELTV